MSPRSGQGIWRGAQPTVPPRRSRSRIPPSDGINGDAHYWGVWHGRDSIGHYNVERARFFSEYGFQSFPEFESVKIYAPQERDWDINSEVMMAHQRAGSYANNLIREYMNDEFVTPDNFEDFLYVGMILQGDAIKTAMEAHRRDMPYCMGTLVWQHNDCWPVASWAGRDYYGRWKAQQYFARNAYRDILVSPVVKGDTLSVNLVSDRRSNARGKFHLRAMTLDGTTVWEKRMNTTAEALTSKKIFESDLKAMIGDRKKGDLIFRRDFRDTRKRAVHQHRLRRASEIHELPHTRFQCGNRTRT